MDIRKNGIRVMDKKKSRVQCNYCGKQMTCFHRLKFHLGGVGPDVTPCEQVTLTVRETFRSMVRKGNPAAKKTLRARDLQIGQRRSNIVSLKKGNTGVDTNKQDSLPNKAQNCIGRFFYENSIDFSVVDSPSFKEMLRELTNVGDCQMSRKFPNSHDLNGWMLQEALEEVKDYVKKIKDSWNVTGCSILLDAWVDQKGRNLVAFVADCPAGPVYLTSFDVTDIKNDVTALISLIDELVEDVGVCNVIQIIACSTSGWVGELSKQFADNKREIFWSVSLSHCVELMLVKIGKMDSFRDVLGKVKNIWEFINNNPSVLDSHGIDMTVSSSGFEFVMPYLNVEKIFKEKNNLVAMFASSDLNKRAEGIAISKLVKDSSFWESVEIVVKCTYPLIHGVLLFSTANNQHVGYIYDTMDGIKENIAREFNHEELYYKPIWDVIDDVWNKHLHSPLHVTGYYLNPAAFYSTDFHHDPEITTGFVSSLVHIIKESHIQAKISTQLVMYTEGKDSFNEASQADQISGISPAEWWAKKANQQPELQHFAVKILSQTYEGAKRYNLKRSLAEKLLLTEGMSHSEQQHLQKLSFVHYNLHLRSCKAILSEVE